MTRALIVQKAVRDVLAAALAVPVYDHVPQDAAMPFVELGAQDNAAADTYDAGYEHHYLYLEVWSAYHGKKEAADICKAIHAALHDASLTLSEGRAPLCRVTDVRVERDGDGRSYQGSVTVHIISGDT